MKVVIPIIVATLLLSGCVTKFLNNGPIDATAVEKTTSISKVDSKNSHFEIYKINSQNYALLPKFSATGGIINRINKAIILDGDQANKLRDTCKAIIEAYSLTPQEDTKVIQYYLVLNDPEISTSGTSVMTSGIINSTARIQKARRIVFYLQYSATPPHTLGSGKKISYMYGSLISEMRIEDVKDLLSDLQK